MAGSFSISCKYNPERMFMQVFFVCAWRGRDAPRSRHRAAYLTDYKGVRTGDR